MVEPPSSFQFSAALVKYRWRQVGFLAFWLFFVVLGFDSIAKSHFSQRLEDLQKIRISLDAYKVEHGVYPKVVDANLGVVSIGDASNPNPRTWIAGLVPKYLSFVPRDPRVLQAANKQYLYFSDGRDFKIVAHGAEDAGFAMNARPDLIDPRRKTFAYGYWTPGASQW